ncbi:MAG TPA: tetratricopeptide repeat protein [Candidatus Binatia bacterium]|nr:tetratricopeptide repeat protein [Candidatus Binatia bacterium]
MLIRYLSIIGIAVFVLSCWRPSGHGVGGQYLDAKTEIARGRHTNVNKAVSHLEYVVSHDPYYKDSLTLLGRTYYMAERYQDAYQILTRALAIRPDDEIAWISLGLTQLRLGDDAKGLESLKGGLTQLAKLSTEHYKGVEFWDTDGYVRTAIRRSVLAVTKGIENKQGIIQTTEVLLTRIDEEEWWQNRKQKRDQIAPQE